jgi:DNA-binding NarL/FixJ family response regulator
VPPASSEQIASELHDVIAHALSAMTVQADDARRTALTRPELARAAYAAIEAAGREALRELRRLREESPLSDALSAMVVQAGGARRVLERDPSRALTAAAGIERTGRDALHDVRDRLGAGAQRAPQPSLAAMGERASLEQRGERLLDDPVGGEVEAGGQRPALRRVGQRGAGARGARRRRAERRRARARPALRRRARPGPRRLAGDVPGMIRLLIADDQALVRAGFRMILEAEEDLEVVGEAVDGLDAVAQARELKPDVVLMDIRMPELDGIEATRRLLAEAGDDPVRVLMLTTFDVNEYVYEALRAGASGFLLKDVPPEELAAGIRVVARGDALLAPSITRRLIQDFAAATPTPPAPPPGLDELTARELEVFRLVARGLSNAEIAAELVVSETTVKTHVARLLMKLGLRDRVQAVVLAYESGVAIPGRPAV